MKRYVNYSPVVLLLLAAFQGTHAAPIYSVDSLKILCEGTQAGETPCQLYLQGVVETWMLIDLESIEPTRFRSRAGQPKFCETIIRVSEEEWVRVIRRSLPTMKPGPASPAVQQALAANLCSE